MKFMCSLSILIFASAALLISGCSSSDDETKNSHSTDSGRKDTADSDTRKSPVDTATVGDTADSDSARNDTADTEPAGTDTLEPDTDTTIEDTAESDPIDSDTVGPDSDTAGGDTASTDCPDSDTMPRTDSEGEDTAETDTTDTEDTSHNDTDTAPEIPATWGWISAIEWNDTCDQWYAKTDWAGGVRAYFAETASYPRSLPHTLDFIPEVASEGNCKLYDAGILANCEGGSELEDKWSGDCFFCIDWAFECIDDIRWCDQDQQCEASDEIETGTCEDLPAHWNMGTIVLEGFKQEITLEPDEYDRYYITDALTDPNDLFNDGDMLTARTAGDGAFPPLTFSTKGVAPLVVSNAVLELEEDNSVTVEWTPSDADSRIQVALISGSHDPNPLTATIVCDVPDGDGSVTIPANLINGFLGESCPEAMMKCSRITRYSRDVIQTKDGKAVEFFVGSARNIQHNMWLEYGEW